MKSKKLLAMLLSGILAFSLAACGNSEPTAASSGSSTSVSTASGASTASKNDPIGKYGEAVTLTWGVPATSVQQFKNGDTYDNNVWSRKIKEDLNVDLKVAWTADLNTEAYNNKLKLCLASGDLPDIFKGNYSIFKQAYEAGYLKDLTEVFDSYAGEYMSGVKDKYKDSFNYVSFDGKMFGIPSLNDNTQMATLLWIRQDWLDNLGMKAPTTIDELYDLAYAFTYKDPDKNGKDDTFGLGLHNQIVSADHASLLGLSGAWGVPLFRQEMFYRDKSGKVTSPVIQPEMKEVLKFVQKMYKDKIIDKEFVVKDQSGLAEDIGKGKIGMAFGQQWGTWYPWNLAFENYGAVVHPYPIPTQEGYDYKLGYNSNCSGDILMVNAKCKNPEAVIKIYNHYNTICNLDMPKETADIYTNDEQYRFNPCWINEPQETTFAPIYREVNKTGDVSSLPQDMVTKYNTYMAFEKGESKKSDAYGLWGVYSQIGSMHIIQTKYQPDNALVQSIMGVQPDSYVEYGPTLEKMVLEQYTKMIMGADVDSTFDTFVQNWLKVGGKKILDDLETMYPPK